MRLDQTDRQIILWLQRDARMANRELAEKVGLAPSTCLQRVRRLRETGVIRGFRADVDPAAVGAGIEALIMIRLNRHAEGPCMELWHRLLAREEVVAMYHLAGSVDFVAHVAVRDVAHLRTLGSEAFTSEKLVSQVETCLIFEHAQSRVLPSYPPEAGNA